MSQHIFSIVTLCLQRKNSNKKTLNKNCAKWERNGLEEKKKIFLFVDKISGPVLKAIAEV
jgi:hypothetical protein